MKVSEQFKRRHLDHLRGYLPQEIAQHSAFETAVSASLDELTRLSTLEVCEARKKGLALTCNSEELAERTFRIASGEEFIAGVRFKNLNTRFPFIEINSSVTVTPNVLNELCEIVQSKFENLRPVGLKFKDKPDVHSNLEKWSHTVFGEIENQQSLQVPAELRFSFTQDLDWHQSYVVEYQERLAEKRELDGFVRVGGLDEFRESARDNALLVANDRDGFCGVISGVQSPLYGLSAIYMIESYLSKRWVGRNVAPIAHAFFLREMEKRFKYVWGTIYDRNLSSLKTALRIGRRIIETEYFVRF